jgi:type III secretory pathway component EscU
MAVVMRAIMRDGRDEVKREFKAARGEHEIHTTRARKTSAPACYSDQITIKNAVFTGTSRISSRGMAFAKRPR